MLLLLQLLLQQADQTKGQAGPLPAEMEHQRLMMRLTITESAKLLGFKGKQSYGKAMKRVNTAAVEGFRWERFQLMSNTHKTYQLLDRYTGLPFDFRGNLTDLARPTAEQIKQARLLTGLSQKECCLLAGGIKYPSTWSLFESASRSKGIDPARFELFLLKTGLHPSLELKLRTQPIGDGKPDTGAATPSPEIPIDTANFSNDESSGNGRHGSVASATKRQKQALVLVRDESAAIGVSMQQLQHWLDSDRFPKPANGIALTDEHQTFLKLVRETIEDEVLDIYWIGEL